MKIFQIGFNKCGTTALLHFFQDNGIKSIHWDRGRLAKQIECNYKHDRPLLEGYEEYQFYGDMECSPALFAHIAFFKQMDHQYPGSKFILNVRNRDAWLLSRCRTNNYLDAFQKQYKLNAAQVIDMWSGQWDCHIADVRRYFAGRQDLLEFNIDTDSASHLINFFPELDLKDMWRKVVPRSKA